MAPSAATAAGPIAPTSASVAPAAEPCGGGQDIWECLESGKEPSPETLGPKFSIEGPFDVGDPVHETITLAALRDAGISKEGERYDSTAAWEYIRGVLWNDDPTGLLFHSDSDARRFSTGFEWYRSFKAAEEGSVKGQTYTSGAPLLQRSHFGDLQFLHGMASRDGETAAVTLAAMLMWAEFSYAVAVGKIAEDTPLDKVPVAGFARLFAKEAKVTPKELFRADKAGDVKRRAIGSILHMIQDSYAGGHSERVAEGPGAQRKISCFYSYTRQHHGKHKADDGWRGGGNDVERLRRAKGAVEAQAASAKVLGLWQRSGKAPAPWSEMKAALLAGPFALAKKPRAAEPGKDYVGKPLAALPTPRASSDGGRRLNESAIGGPFEVRDDLDRRPLG